MLSIEHISSTSSTAVHRKNNIMIANILLQMYRAGG